MKFMLKQSFNLNGTLCQIITYKYCIDHLWKWYIENIIRHRFKIIRLITRRRYKDLKIKKTKIVYLIHQFTLTMRKSTNVCFLIFENFSSLTLFSKIVPIRTITGIGQ